MTHILKERKSDEREINQSARSDGLVLEYNIS